MNRNFLPALTIPVLAPISMFYSFVVTVRNALFDLKVFRSYRPKLPVISVGNITVGGNGKTPLTMYISSVLKNSGRKPVILSRGYKGRETGPTIVLSDDSTRLVGDEPKLMTERGHVVVVSKDKVAGAKFIESRQLGDVIILDDGLQSRRLQRDLELLCVELTTPTSLSELRAGHLLPWGTLRESLSGAIRRINGIVFNLGANSKDTVARFNTSAEIFGQQIPKFMARVETASVEGLFNKTTLPICAVTLVSSVAKPKKIIETLSAKGFLVKEAHFFRDHYEFSENELLKLVSSSVNPIVCTEKDAVKIKEFASLKHAPIYVAKIDLVIIPDISNLIISAITGGVR